MKPDSILIAIAASLRESATRKLAQGESSTAILLNQDAWRIENDKEWLADICTTDKGIK